MAITTYSPQPDPDDLVTTKDASALLDVTPHPASRSTINRWVTLYGIETFRRGRCRMVSMSDVFEAQREEFRPRPQDS